MWENDAQILIDAAFHRVNGNDPTPASARVGYWCARALAARSRFGWEGEWATWVRFARLSRAPVDVLRDIATGCRDNTNRSWIYVKEVVVALCDNPAIPHDLFCELDRHFGGEGSDLPELGACNPRYANEIARKLILNRPEGFSDAHDVPRHILDGVICGAVTDEEVLAYLCEPREWSTEYAGEPEYAEGASSEWTKSDARKLRERLGR